jgi:hypothetical protein
MPLRSKLTRLRYEDSKLVSPMPKLALFLIIFTLSAMPSIAIAQLQTQGVTVGQPFFSNGGGGGGGDGDTKHSPWKPDPKITEIIPLGNGLCTNGYRQIKWICSKQPTH